MRTYLCFLLFPLIAFAVSIATDPDAANIPPSPQRPGDPAAGYQYLLNSAQRPTYWKRL